MYRAWVSVLSGNYEVQDRIPEDRLTQSAYLVEKDLLHVGCFDVHCIYVIPGKMTKKNSFGCGIRNCPLLSRSNMLSI